MALLHLGASPCSYASRFQEVHLAVKQFELSGHSYAPLSRKSLAATLTKRDGGSPPTLVFSEPIQARRHSARLTAGNGSDNQQRFHTRGHRLRKWAVG